MGRRHSTVGTLALVLSLALAGDASAATCHIDGPNNWNLGASWSCSDGTSHVPGPADLAVVNAGDHPVVTGNPLAKPGSLSISDSGRIVFSNGAAMRVGDMTALSGSINGEGSLTVEGTFVKDQLSGGALSTFSVMNEGAGGKAPDLVLDGPARLEGGAMCVGRGDDADPDQPSLQINDTFRITDDPEVARFVFPCTSGPRIRVNAPDGHLVVEAADPTTEVGTMIVNDGTLTVETGKLVLWGGTASETSDGAYVASEDATLQMGTCCSENFQVGPAGRVGGPGTIVVSGPVTLADGATLDPAVLDLPFQLLTLQGDAPLSLPVVNITGGWVNSTRDVTVKKLAVTHGLLQGEFVLTVPADGTFAKTTDGQFFVTNFGGTGSPDLVLDTDASIDAGSFCVGRNGDQDPDLPTVQINQDFTIGTGAATQALGCGSGIAPEYIVNGPDGHLHKTGAGTLQMQNKLGVAGGKVTVAAGQTFELTNGMTQSAGLTEIASGGVVQGPSGPVAIGGGVLAGAGQITTTLAHTGGTVRPAGTLTVGAYTQGAGGTLEVDLATGAQDRLAVTGAASLAGTLAAVPSTGFDPAPAAAFPVVTSGSRTGAFATLTGTRLPGGKRLALEYPGTPDFGARLVVTSPQDLVVGDCDDPALATVTEVTGDLIVDGVAGCDAVELPALEDISGDLVITGNDSAEAISLAELGTVGGDLTITGNDSAEAISLAELGTVGGDLTITGNDSSEAISLAELGTVGGDLTLTDNGDATVALGSPDQVGGDLTLDTTGSGPIALGDGSPAGDLDLDTTGYGEVSGATAGGTTTIANAHPEAQMRVLLPDDAFSAPVPFTVTRLDPAALPPEGNVDPVVAYAFEFGVPTLNSPAELSFAVRLSGLDQGTRDALLAALADGRATLATRGAGAYQTFPLCVAGQAPSADGCVRAERPNPDLVRFTGVVGHFSTWAVAIVAKPPVTTGATPTPRLTPTPAPPSKPAFGARTLVTLKPTARRIRARGPLRIHVANANAFAVGGRLVGASTKRLGKRRAALRARKLSVPALASRTVALKLPKAVRSRLARGARVALKLRATVTDPAGNRRTVTKRFTVRRR